MSKPTKNTIKEAQSLVVQSYWDKDQELKCAQTARGKLHDLALLAVPTGTTAGPATDADGMPHWLTHGERESVQIDAIAFWRVADMRVPDLLDFFTVDAAKVKAEMPEAYAKLLNHRSTRRTRHDCLTWSDRRRVAKTKGSR